MPVPQPRVATGPLGPGELEDWYAVPQGSTPRRWVRGSFVTTLVGRATHLLTWGQDVLVRIRLG